MYLRLINLVLGVNDSHRFIINEMTIDVER